MPVFSHADNFNHEQVVFCRNDDVGLKAIIAIHDTQLGPALGGCRFYPYASEADALRDVLRLARGMTYKASCAGLNLGGGKAVILGDPRKDKSEALMRAFGCFVESLGGRYITAEDSGTTVADMDHIRVETSHVCGVSAAAGGSGDPSPVTAWGVFHGVRAALHQMFGSADVGGRTVAVQGVGNVGYHLVKYLTDEGAKTIITDVDEARLERCRDEFGSTVVSPDAIYDAEADVFSPCALGAIINDDTIERLKVKIVAGGSNNQLDNMARHGARLKERKILYAPDYVINAGGLINVYSELHDLPREKALRDAERIYETLHRIFATAIELGITTAEAANLVAEKRIREIGKLASFQKPLMVRGPVA
ncbi:MAG: Glu/Leu/Phe/Val dehydrogenase [Proteobacteria bacterium]|nr:Glu/Leu/Phe/Val dehydrogenase [Pseudomonadota bacterium]